jgi:hypothetical protein
MTGAFHSSAHTTIASLLGIIIPPTEVNQIEKGWSTALITALGVQLEGMVSLCHIRYWYCAQYMYSILSKCKL